MLSLVSSRKNLVVVSIVVASLLGACGSDETRTVHGGEASAGSAGAAGAEASQTQGGSSGASEGNGSSSGTGVGGHEATSGATSGHGSANGAAKSGAVGDESSSSAGVSASAVADAGAAGTGAWSQGASHAGEAGAYAGARATVTLNDRGSVSEVPVDGVTLEVRLLTESESETLIGEMPEGVELAGAVSLVAPDGEVKTFSSPLSVEFPNEIDATDEDQLLVGEVVDLDDQEPSEIVYRGVARTGSIMFDTATTGTFAVMRTATPLGVVRGTLSAADGAPIRGGVVASALSAPFVALTESDGAFLLPAGPAGSEPTVFGAPGSAFAQLPGTPIQIASRGIAIPAPLPRPNPILIDTKVDLRVGSEESPDTEDCRCDPIVFGRVFLASAEGQPAEDADFHVAPGGVLHIHATDGTKTWGLAVPETVDFLNNLVRGLWALVLSKGTSCSTLLSMVSFYSGNPKVAEFPIVSSGELVAHVPDTTPIDANIQEMTFKVCKGGKTARASGSASAGAEVVVACAHDVPVWNQGARICEACPDRLPLWNADALACEPCPEDRPVRNLDTETCEACPEDRPVWDSDAEACEACPGSKVWNNEIDACECPEETPVWNDSTLLCESCPSDAPSWNAATGGCEPCERGAVWDEPTRTCRCREPSGGSGPGVACYVDCHNGNDSNSGTSEDQALRTLGAVPSSCTQVVLTPDCAWEIPSEMYDACGGAETMATGSCKLSLVCDTFSSEAPPCEGGFALVVSAGRACAL